MANQSKSEEVLIDKDLMQMLSYIQSMKLPDETEVKKREVFLGEIKMNKTLVFDLDETLIHSQLISSETKDKNFDFIIKHPSGE